jgi:hypothetical protein
MVTKGAKLGEKPLRFSKPLIFLDVYVFVSSLEV